MSAKAKTNTNVTVDESGAVVDLTVVSGTISKEDFNKLELKRIGLDEKDYEAVIQTACSIDINDPNSINNFGSTLGIKSKSSTSELLEMVKAKDLDVTGRQLNQILVIAQNTNANGLGKNKLQKLPIVGKLIGAISSTSRNISNSLQNTDQMLNSIIEEIDENKKGLADRVNHLNDMYSGVEEEYHQLGISIASGQILVEKMDAAINEIRKENIEDQLTVQKINDLTNTRNRLGKRVSDLYLLQQSCLQTLPQIRIIQNNNLALMDKFQSIQAVTLPAWRNQISLTLSLEEQQRSVKLTTAIDDTTNDLLRRNAELLRQNSIETAKSNQRSVIDVDTLKTVQQELINTVQETRKISEEGQRKRLEAQKELIKLQNDLSSQILIEADNKQKIGMKTP